VTKDEASQLAEGGSCRDFERRLGYEDEGLTVVLWDVMDTLVHDPFRDAMPAFFGLTLDELLLAKHPTAWGAFERGQTSEQEFLASFFRDHRVYDTAAFVDCIRASYAWVEGMEPLLASVRASGCPMHVLSNYPEWYGWIEERLGISRYMPWSFVSCRTRVRKPEAEAFHLAARELGVAPGECLLIDDRPQNCAAARGIGMNAIWFQGSATLLQDELVERGVLKRAR
jgi:HAD superfamily hydrolase (TIGR01509 family)